MCVIAACHRNSEALVNYEWRSIVRALAMDVFPRNPASPVSTCVHAYRRQREREWGARWRRGSIDSNTENDNASHNKCEGRAGWGELPATYAIDLLDPAMCVTRIKDRQTPALIQLI